MCSADTAAVCCPHVMESGVARARLLAQSPFEPIVLLLGFCG